MQREIIIIAALLLPVSYCLSQKPQSRLEAKVSVYIESEPLANALKIIEEAGNFKFAYSSNDVDLSREITLVANGESLISLLRKIFPDSNIVFKERGNKVLIIKTIPPSILQTVRGVVLEAETKQPIPGANVIITNTEPLLGAPTDIYGRYKIENVPVGRVSVQATFSGYKPFIISNMFVDAGKELVLNISLKESVTELQAVVVIADLDKARPINEMAMVSAKSFTVEETSKYAGSFNDPARMATTYAGVIGAQDDTDNGIIIRGNSPKGLQWRLEGVEIPNPNHFASDGASSGAVGMLNSNVLTNSDFMTGAFPAEYGNAFSGVFDLKLRNGNNEKREYSIQAGLLGIDASFEGPIKRTNGKQLPNASYLVNYRYSTISILEKLGLNIANNALSIPVYQDLAFKFNMPTEKAGTFSWYGLGGKSKSHETFENLGANQPLRDREKYQMGLTGISNVLSLGDNSFLETNLSYSITQYDFLLNVRSNNQVFDEDIEDYTNESTRLSTTYNTKFNARHSSKWGVVYTRLGYDINSVGKTPEGQPLYQANEKGGFGMWQSFISHKFNVTDEFSLTGGLHYIRLNLNGQDNIEPRLGARWQFANNQWLSFGFGIHSRREETSLYFTELFRSDLTAHQPNTKLELAKARHFVVGYDRTFNKDFHLKLEVYYQDLYNIPVGADPTSLYSSLNQENAFQRVALINKGKGRNYGLEFTFEKFLSRGYFFLTTASIYDSRFKAQTGGWFNTRYNGRYNVNLVGGKEFKLRGVDKQKLLNVGLETVLGGGVRTTEIDLQSSIDQGKTIYFLDRPFGRQLPDYIRIDFQIGIKTNKKGRTHEWRVDIQNLTSRSNLVREMFSASKEAIIPSSYTGEIIPVLSYKLTF